MILWSKSNNIICEKKCSNVGVCILRNKSQVLEENRTWHQLGMYVFDCYVYFMKIEAIFFAK